MLLFFLVSCKSEPLKYRIKWDLKEGNLVSYEAVVSQIELDQNFKTHGYKVFDDDEVRNKIKASLRSLKRPIATMEAKLSPSANGFRAKFVTTKPTYENLPENDEEKLKREALASQAGTVEVLADISFSGELQSFYLKQKQRNLVSLFFKLPEEPISIGDKWSIPIDLIEIGQGFVPSEAKRKQEVELQSVSKNDQGHEIADIFYIITEMVEGQFEYSYTDEVVPIKSEYTYYALGKFNLQAGRWEDFVAISYISGAGTSVSENMMVHSLKLK